MFAVEFVGNFAPWFVEVSEVLRAFTLQQVQEEGLGPLDGEAVAKDHPAVPFHLLVPTGEAVKGGLVLHYEPRPGGSWRARAAGKAGGDFVATQVVQAQSPWLEQRSLLDGFECLLLAEEFPGAFLDGDEGTLLSVGLEKIVNSSGDFRIAQARELSPGE